MSESKDKVIVIPCSGIGRVFGSVGREAAYEVLEKLRPEDTETVCLSLLVMGDDEAQARVQAHPTIAIDGCPNACAQKNIALAGGQVGAAVPVFDVYKEHRELKSRSVSVLDEKGRLLAQLVAERVAEKVDELLDRSG
jgi:uncharacterized metal-binding protein